jgi:DNA-binding response OmpR family regulator
MEILVIDDEMVMRSLITIALQRESYAVFSVDNPYEAMRHLRVSIPDLIVLDVMMPGMDGIKLCQHIRALAPDVPIVVFSALGDKNSIESAYRAGANIYLHKLQLTDELVAVVSDIFEAQTPLANAT